MALDLSRSAGDCFEEDKIPQALWQQQAELLKRQGLIDELDLMHLNGDGHYYERKLQRDHIHMACLRCGKITEFVSDSFERLKQQVERDCRFRVLVSRLEIGGYCAALLLGAAYLAIGLLVSSFTENQILAFLATLAICFALWLVGEEFVTRLFPVSVAGALEKIGTGARFRSVGRGVLDLGDLAYYATIVASALAANAASLEWRKG